jgi:hypothetical protein
MQIATGSPILTLVWVGHSCPTPLTLILTLLSIFPKRHTPNKIGLGKGTTSVVPY